MRRVRQLRHVSGSPLPDLLAAGLIALLFFVVVRNAFDYEPISGFDAEEHIGYARTLIEECGATFLGVAAIVDQLPPDRRHQLLRVHTLLPRALLGDDAEEPTPG